MWLNSFISIFPAQSQQWSPMKKCQLFLPIKCIGILTLVEKEESSSVVLVFENLQCQTQCFWSYYLQIWMQVKNQEHRKVYTVIHEELKKMGTGETIDFSEFLARLKLTFHEYILAICSSLKSATIFLKRTPSEIRVNAYNPVLIKAWRANMDIQFVTNVFACAM